jgi:tRNA (cmo5U34)-methyltransferase
VPSTPAPTDDPTPDVAEQFGAGGWEFTEGVADVFPDHVRASVPFYDAIQDLVAELADWLVPDGGLVADLGAATGITADRVLSRQPGRRIRFALYDEQPAMLARAAELISGRAQAEEHARRLEDGPLNHTAADLTLALFTLQFLRIDQRAQVLRAARNAAASSGALLVAEKIRPPDARWAEIAGEVSHDWKSAHGISDSAIRAKARALRGILTPAAPAALMSMITAGGWHQPEVLFRWHQWIVVGAFATADGAPHGPAPGFGGPHASNYLDAAAGGRGA